MPTATTITPATTASAGKSAAGTTAPSAVRAMPTSTTLPVCAKRALASVPTERMTTAAAPLAPAMLAHYRRLGITALNLLPVQQHVDEARLVDQKRQPVALERNLVIVVEVIDPDDHIAARQQLLAEGITDKAGGAGDKNTHKAS